MPNGSTVAVEVTRHISEADAECTGITRGLKKRDWRSRDLANDWSVVVEMPSKGKRVGRRIHKRLRQLQAQAPALLVEMERTGEKISYIRQSGRASPLEDKFSDLGIRAIYGLGPAVSSDGGMTWIEPYFPSGWAGDEIPAAVEKPIDDNLDKLLKSKGNGASEAHLFVWLELGPHTQASVAVMASGRPARSVPDLQGLDVVWVAIHDGHNPRKWGIWRCTADGWNYLSDSSNASGAGSIVLWDD